MKQEIHNMSITQEDGNIIFTHYIPGHASPISDMNEWAEKYDELTEQRDIEYENIPTAPMHHMELYFWICPNCGETNDTYKSKTGIDQCTECGEYTEVKG